MTLREREGKKKQRSLFKVRGRWKMDSLLSGEQVGVIHQFLGVLEAALKKGPANSICETGSKQNSWQRSAKRCRQTNLLRRRWSSNSWVAAAAYLSAWREPAPGWGPARKERREASLEETKDAKIRDHTSEPWTDGWVQCQSVSVTCEKNGDLLGDLGVLQCPVSRCRCRFMQSDGLRPPRVKLGEESKDQFLLPPLEFPGWLWAGHTTT